MTLAQRKTDEQRGREAVCDWTIASCKVAAAERGVRIARCEDYVEHEGTVPVACSPIGAVVLDAPARHYREEAARILGISEEEVSAVEAGFQGWDQDDHDPRWYEIGQWYAVQMGLECPEIAWPEERSELPSYEEWLRR